MAKTFKSTEGKGAPTQEEIAKRAFEVFERNGCKPGQDLANWLAAEAELKNEKAIAPAHPAAIQPSKRESHQAPQRKL